MSYQVLARKWRPKDFSQLMGQEHVVDVLFNALEQKRLHHAYLFTGTRGVGKTTIARIFAKSLNCEQGISAKPCGQCETCLDIDAGRYIDLLEIDAASKTKVDDTREILDNVQYAPSRGRFKVYLIDEVHMLSRSSFNALLKTLEEPPEHVKFILATTDPQKLPITVLSRCLQFHLKALTVEQIKQQLNTILAAEEVSVESMALNQLAKSARGSMRDCLSLTDQAIAQGRGSITFENVQKMLGGVDHQWAFNILTCLVKQDGKALMSLSQDIASFAPNYSQVLAQLIQLLHQVALSQVVGNHFEFTAEQKVIFDKLCQLLSPEDVQLYYQLAIQARKDLSLSLDEQAGFDMALIRMLAFKPLARPEKQESESVVLEQSDTNELTLLSSPQNNQFAESVPNTQESIQADTQALLDEQQQEILTQAVEQGFETTTSSDPHSTVIDNENADGFIEPLLDPRMPTSQLIDKTDANREGDAQQLNDANLPSEPQVKLEKQGQGALSQVTSDILATRNMLRSRKKGLDKPEKKPDDAKERQLATPIKPVDDLPAEEELPQQPYNPEIIDPSIIKKANQVDKWAFMIDAMGLNGRIRQLAINAVISEKSDDDNLILMLDQNTKHLQSESAHEQLQSFISQYLKKPVTVHIDVIEQTQVAPFNIQSDINDKRLTYAKEIIVNDEVVHKLQSDFQAQLDESSIAPR